MYSLFDPNLYVQLDLRYYLYTSPFSSGIELQNLKYKMIYS